MPVADAAVAAIASFAARCTVDGLPAELLAAHRRALRAAVEALTAGDQDEPALEAAIAGAGRALGVAGRPSGVLDAFSLGCRLAASGRSPVGPEEVPVGLLGLGAGLGAARSAPRATADDLLAAVVAGTEVQARLARIAARAGERGKRWRLDQLLSYFGAAVTAARVLGLDEAATESAVGLALTVASGSVQGLATTTPLGWLGGGLACAGGVWAALQAEAGIGARYGALFAPFGLFPLYFGVEEDGGELAGLGSAFSAFGEPGGGDEGGPPIAAPAALRAALLGG